MHGYGVLTRPTGGDYSHLETPQGWGVLGTKHPNFHGFFWKFCMKFQFWNQFLLASGSKGDPKLLMHVHMSPVHVGVHQHWCPEPYVYGTCVWPWGTLWRYPTRIDLGSLN